MLKQVGIVAFSSTIFQGVSDSLMDIMMRVLALLMIRKKTATFYPFSLTQNELEDRIRALCKR